MNQTIKNSLGKVCQETGSRGQDISPCEVLQAPSHTQALLETPREWGKTELGHQLQALGKFAQDISAWVNERCPVSLFCPVHPFSPGDHVWIKDCSAAPLKPQWKGPQTMILTTPTAVKVEGIPAWIHHSCLKLAAAETSEVMPNPDNDYRITLKRTTSPAPATSQKLAGPRTAKA
ncbi:Gag-Pol polyprotein [Plecturocebus cupreus]